MIIPPGSLVDAAQEIVPRSDWQMTPWN